MSLPTWALFMKKCYADPTLNVSKEAFEKPDYLSINVDCNKVVEENKTIFEEEDDTDF